MTVMPVITPVDEAREVEIEAELLTPQEVAETLRSALGPDVSEDQIARAASALQMAQAERWEQLPKDINPDMGFNLGFLPCSETCWMGRQVLIEGATFRVFRQRS